MEPSEPLQFFLGSVERCSVSLGSCSARKAEAMCLCLPEPTGWAAVPLAVGVAVSGNGPLLLVKRL